jgi:hypothetical protein
MTHGEARIKEYNTMQGKQGVIIEGVTGGCKYWMKSVKKGMANIYTYNK